MRASFSLYEHPALTNSEVWPLPLPLSAKDTQPRRTQHARALIAAASLLVAGSVVVYYSWHRQSEVVADRLLGLWL
ncbi:hypothetical protein DXG03_006749 [Asterophora parasitica]|uniref:Uncharacterized protein n=1 Tax=Asterophora parasitica TaxID=117018 RepID=A0A9P7G0U0_9AGAR|nr:hypothetical protein DXG03_006749 [Asterophora parasitica]